MVAVLVGQLPADDENSNGRDEAKHLINHALLPGTSPVIAAFLARLFDSCHITDPVATLFTSLRYNSIPKITTDTMPPVLLSSKSEVLFNIAGAASAFPLGLGLIGLVNPANGFRLFGFGEPSTPEGKKLGTNLLLFWVSRDLYMGVGALAAWWLNERKALGAMCVAGCGVVLKIRAMTERISCIS